jgi:hypothetical protein
MAVKKKGRQFLRTLGCPYRCPHAKLAIGSKIWAVHGMIWNAEAGEGNRTLLAGLGSQCITTMLRPRVHHLSCQTEADTLKTPNHTVSRYSCDNKFSIIFAENPGGLIRSGHTEAVGRQDLSFLSLDSAFMAQPPGLITEDLSKNEPPRLNSPPKSSDAHQMAVNSAEIA